MVRRAGDLASKYVRRDRAEHGPHVPSWPRAEGAVLLLDRADSFLRSRKHAERNYEVSRSTMLAGMERACRPSSAPPTSSNSTRRRWCRFAFKIRVSSP